jgi:hypothetical protein
MNSSASPRSASTKVGTKDHASNLQTSFEQLVLHIGLPLLLIAASVASATELCQFVNCRPSDALASRHMTRGQERDILERAVRIVAEQTKNASAVVNEAHNAGLDGSHPLTVQAKMLRLELLNVKADLERES